MQKLRYFPDGLHTLYYMFVADGLAYARGEMHITRQDQTSGKLDRIWKSFHN